MGQPTWVGKNWGSEANSWQGAKSYVHPLCRAYTKPSYCDIMTSIVTSWHHDIPPVRNCITQIKNLTHWLKASPKKGFLKAIVWKGIQNSVGVTRNPILNVCITQCMGRKHWWLGMLLFMSSFPSTALWSNHLWHSRGGIWGLQQCLDIRWQERCLSLF